MVTPEEVSCRGSLAVGHFGSKQCMQCMWMFVGSSEVMCLP